MSDLSDDLAFTEGLRKQDETAREAFLHKARHFGEELWHVSKAALQIYPFIVLAMLTIDLPVYLFDGISKGAPFLEASNWFSRGEGLMILSFFALALVTRRYGSVVALRAQAMAWMFATLTLFLVYLVLAPEISPEDLPSGLYITAFLMSWYLGQSVCIFVYDLTRGGKWWRAPLYGSLFGFGFQTLLFFIMAYSTVRVPWINWMVTDYFIKAVFAVIILIFYSLLRRSIKPFMGLGGM